MKQILSSLQAVLLAMLTAAVTLTTTSCSDNDDNPAQEQSRKNRKEFTSHTRSVLKELAENLPLC